MISHIAPLSFMQLAQGAGGMLLPATWRAASCLHRAGFASKSKATPPYLKEAQQEQKKSSRPQKQDKIPRALGAYNYFVKDRAAVLKQQPGYKAKDLMTVLGQEWKALTPDQKRPYENLAAKSKAETAAAKEIARSNKAPPSAYNIWCGEVVKDLKSSNPNMKVTEMMTEAAARWKVLPANEKERRQAEAQAAKEEWSKQQKCTSV